MGKRWSTWYPLCWLGGVWNGSVITRIVVLCYLGFPSILVCRERCLGWHFQSVNLHPFLSAAGYRLPGSTGRAQMPWQSDSGQQALLTPKRKETPRWEMGLTITHSTDENTTILSSLFRRHSCHAWRRSTHSFALRTIFFSYIFTSRNDA